MPEPEDEVKRIIDQYVVSSLGPLDKAYKELAGTTRASHEELEKYIRRLQNLANLAKANAKVDEHRTVILKALSLSHLEANRRVAAMNVANLSLAKSLKSPEKAIYSFIFNSQKFHNQLVNMTKTLSFIHPEWTKNITKTKQGRWALASATVGMSIFSLITKTLMDTMRGALGINRLFIGSINETSTEVMRNAKLYTDLALSTALYGLKQDDILRILDTSISTYALQGAIYNKNLEATEQQLIAFGEAVTTTSALAEAAGLSADQASELTSNLILTGAPVENLNLNLAKFVVSGKRAGLTFSDFAGIFATLAPVSLLTRDAINKTENTFMRLGITMRNMRDPLFDVVGKHRIFADAMKELARASAALDIPALLAFGGMLEPGAPGRLSDALDRALRAYKPDVLIKQLSFVMDAVTDQTEAVSVGTLFLAQQLRMPLEQARALAAAAHEIRKKQLDASIKRDVAEEKRAQEMLEQLQQQAAMSAAVKDPIERLVELVERILGYLTSFMAGPVGAVLSTAIRGAGKITEAIRR